MASSPSSPGALSASDGASAPSPSAAASTAIAPSAQASSSALVVGGDRPVAVHVPPSYDKGRPSPLLIVLHGYTGSGSDQEAYFGLQREAEQRGFVTAYPDGTMDSRGDRFWNATDACCNFDGRAIDDVAYLDGLITAIEATVTIDPHRVYIAGHSNGGFMSYRLACTHADRIAAIVSLAGATFAKPADCRPTEPVAVLQIHGTADDTIAFAGGSIEGRAYPGAGETVATWARYDGCATAASSVDQRVDVDADLTDAGQPAEATVKRWSGCKPGGAVELWTIPGGGHVPKISDAFGPAVLGFLEAHPKP
ncbi:MAG TPA: alpha/beta fold hydrolase [Candidatus Deferrimicrobium sp.]|nr:alpha/beta fold hydrolase [Candidatus Deferrimicrobium sp.]